MHMASFFNIFDVDNITLCRLCYVGQCIWIDKIFMSINEKDNVCFMYFVRMIRISEL